MHRNKEMAMLPLLLMLFIHENFNCIKLVLYCVNAGHVIFY